MSRMGRIRRHAGHSVATHDRARSLAAERLDEPLQPAETAWLEDHLARCPGCRSIATAYEADRVALRGLRDRQPEPPRDLWARTSAAIERESRSRGGRSRRSASPRRRSTPALGVLSAVAVIAVVVGATVMSGGLVRGPNAVDAPPGGTPQIAVVPSGGAPRPTPMAVGAGSVGWIGTSSNGALAYNVTKVSEVCPADRQPDCAQVSDKDSKPVQITIRPKSISQSPVKNQAVVVGTDANGVDAVVVIALPTPKPSPTLTPPTATPTAPTSATPTAPPSATPPVTPVPTDTPATSKAPATPLVVPSTTPPASVEPTPTVSPSASPSVTPEPTVAASLAIVSGVKVVGQSAAYSPDGDWFAFSARPSDGSAGPDIYVWRVGDELAHPLTDDHASVFASWAGRRMLGSRVAPSATTGEPEARSFFIDPSSGDETAVTGQTWRPTVDPNGHWAVTWDGTVKVDDDGKTIVPASGSLVVRGFTQSGGVDTAGPPAAKVTDGPFAEFDARWDVTGTWLAVWLADASDPAIGRLSLFQLDPVSGGLVRPRGAPHDVTALPGFSIDDGRLAWATPPGQSGEGSRVQIVAWTDQAVGAVESGPVEGVVVVH